MDNPQGAPNDSVSAADSAHQETPPRAITFGASRDFESFRETLRVSPPDSVQSFQMAQKRKRRRLRLCLRLRNFLPRKRIVSSCSSRRAQTKTVPSELSTWSLAEMTARPRPSRCMDLRKLPAVRLRNGTTTIFARLLDP